MQKLYLSSFQIFFKQMMMMMNMKSSYHSWMKFFFQWKMIKMKLLFQVRYIYIYIHASIYIWVYIYTSFSHFLYSNSLPLNTIKENIEYICIYIHTNTQETNSLREGDRNLVKIEYMYIYVYTYILRSSFCSSLCVYCCCFKCCLYTMLKFYGFYIYIFLLSVYEITSLKTLSVIPMLYILVQLEFGNINLFS